MRDALFAWAVGMLVAGAVVAVAAWGLVRWARRIRRDWAAVEHPEADTPLATSKERRS